MLAVMIHACFRNYEAGLNPPRSFYYPIFYDFSKFHIFSAIILKNLIELYFLIVQSQEILTGA